VSNLIFIRKVLLHALKRSEAILKATTIVMSLYLFNKERYFAPILLVS